MEKILAIDIGGTEIKVGIVKKDYSIENKKSYKTKIEGIDLKDRLISVLKANINSEINGIAVSSAGQIDSKTGMVIEAVGDSFIGYKGINLIELLNKEFSLPVSVENDANCAALAEWKTGAAKECDNFFLITIGTGIGGGIVSHGRILNGSLGIAGEIGHLTINYKGEKCNCGNRGCYEMYGSTTALVKRIKHIANVEEEIDGKWIFNELKLGNKLIEEEYKRWIYDVSVGLVTLIHLFNPEVLVIGGGISKQGDLLIKPIEDEVRKLSMKSFNKNLKIVTAMHSNDAALIGATINFLYYNNL